MVTVSHSKLNTFQQCPKKYKFKYIDKAETDISTTIEGYMGDKVHRALEKLYKDLQFMKLNEEQELIYFYNDIWYNEWDDNILIVKDQYSSENYRAKGEKMIRDFYNRKYPFDQEKTLGLETQFYYDLDDEHNIHIRIDRLAQKEQGVYEIHDYKTSSNLPTQEEADRDRQLAIYSMGVKEKYPDAKEVVLVWHYLGFDKEIRSKRTDEEREELRKDVLSIIKEIQEEKEFNTQRSALCDYCEYQKICPLWKHLFEAKKKNFKDDDGVKLVDRYALLKEKEDLVKRKLEEASKDIEDFAEQKNVKSIFGSEQMVTLWSKNVMKAPRKDDPVRPEFISSMKSLNLFDVYADVDNWAFEKDYDRLSEVEKSVLNHFLQ